MMNFQLVLCTLATILLHSVGSVNHVLCLQRVESETGGETTSGGEGGPGPGGSACEITTISINSSSISYVNPYQTYLVHQCTTRAQQSAPRLTVNGGSSRSFSLASTQQQPPSTHCPCPSKFGFFSSFSLFFLSDSKHLVKGRWLQTPERDSSSTQQSSSPSSSSHLSANNTYHLEARPCAPISTSSSTITATTISQLQSIRRRRRRNITISNNRIRNIRSRSMLQQQQQYGSTSDSTSSSSSVLALSPLYHQHHHHHLHQTLEHHWSPANVELFQAVAKVTILVLLKLLIKYYVRGYFKAAISSKALFELLDLTSKALTIAIAKCAIKWALYPALRTAAKTLLIASLRSLLKPITSPLIKGAKKQGAISEKQPQNGPPLASSSLKFALTLGVKVVIKTTALEMLVLVFENEATQLPLHQLMARVTLILLVKMGAKRVCKLGKQRVIQQKELSSNKKCDTSSSSDEAADDVKGNNNSSVLDTSAPVDKMLMFAIQKLVTKLVKIPVIKMLL